MRARQLLTWLLVLIVATMTVGCLPMQLGSTAPIVPVVMPDPPLEITTDPASPQSPTPNLQGVSGVRLTAHISPMCAGEAQPGVECVRPYAGEFVVTELNGAEVTSVATDGAGQATVDLAPGEYIVGVRIEAMYPRAEPVTVNVLADQYAFISFNLDSGNRR